MPDDLTIVSAGFGQSSVEEEARPLHLLIIDPKSLRRICMAAALEGPGLRVASASSVEDEHSLETADILILQLGDSVRETALLAEQIDQIGARWPNASVLIIADQSDETLFLSAISAGAQGLLLSSTSVADIQKTVSLLVKGLAVFPASVVRTMQARRTRRQRVSTSRSDDRIGSAVDQSVQLTQRQRDVLQLLARGASNKMIAKCLQISESTVKVHVRAIMVLNGASNRTQIVANLLNAEKNER